MKRLISTTVLTAVASVLLLSAPNAMAQRQGGNFDPEEIRQRMMERYKEQLDIQSEDEWKAIQTRIEKVMAAQRDLAAVSGRGGFGGFGGFGRGRGDAGGQGGEGGRRQGGGGRGGFGQPSPEQQALQQAVESKASADELKAKLAKLREARKQKQADLEKAQEDLRKVLTVRQEAAAVLLGLLN